MQCQGCGANVKAGGRFCEHCGTRLPRTCGTCGAEVSAVAQFCQSCGIKLSSTAEPQITDAAAQATPQIASRVHADEEGERRQATIMFCDLVDSTTLSATLDPE